jgi:hypothetical protein
VIWTALGLAAALLAFAHPLAHADVWANVGPASPLGVGGLDGRYPLGNYVLDEHFTAISAGVFSGVDVSGVAPMIAYFFANELWQLTAWLANTLIDLFAFAFSLDLLGGSGATSGAGALGPVARAIHSIYSTVFGGPWLVLGVSVAGLWAMWKALVQRRYSETAGQLALSLTYIAIALFFVLQPAQTIGTASGWTNEMSGAFLSIAKDGSPGSQEEAEHAGADQLFGLLVAQPWSVLQFGGLEHCVKAGSGSGESEATSEPVQPLPAEASRRLEAGEEVSAGGKMCVNNLKKYGAHFLRFASGSDERNEEFEALAEGDASKLPDADPGKASHTYKLGPADEPAAAAMEEGGQYQRLLVAIVAFCAELGAFCLLGALSLGVILAQVLLLLLLAFSPVALVAAAIPGRGHQFFKAWLAKLAGYLLRKAAYSLILAILLAVCAAIAAATSELGWLLSFGLQCAFFWAVFLQRRSLSDGLVGIVTGPGAPGRERALSVLALYAGARTASRVTRAPRRLAGGALRAPSSLARGALGRLQGGGGPRGADAGVPLGGVRDRKDVGRSDTATASTSPAPEGPGRSQAEGQRREGRPGARRHDGDDGGDEGPRSPKPRRRSPRENEAAAAARQRSLQIAKGTGAPPRGDSGAAEGGQGAAPKRSARGRKGSAPQSAQSSRSAARPAGSPIPSKPPAEKRSELSEELRAERAAGAAQRGRSEVGKARPPARGSQPAPRPPVPPRAPASRRRRFGKGRRVAKGRRFRKGGEKR